MAIEKVIDINVKGNADEAVGSLRSQLRAAQADVAALSDKFGATSKQATEAAKKAGELKDKIADAKALTDAFNPDAKFKSLTASLSGVAGGFAAVQGGMALIGVESKDVEATLLKVQSAMALSSGLQAVGESIDSFKQLGAVVQSSTAFKKLDTLATAAATVVQRLFSSAVNTTAVSFNVLKTAIVTTGIGALVVGLGYLVSKMNDSSDATKELTEEQKRYNRELEYGKTLTEDAAKSIDYNTQIELANAKKRGDSDKELTKIKVEGANAKIKSNTDEINNIRATQTEEYNLTAEQTKRIAELRAANLALERQAKIEIANFDADQAIKAREAQKKIDDEKDAKKRKDIEAAAAQAKKDAEDLKAALLAQKTAQENNAAELTKAIGDAQDRQAEKTMSASEIEQRVVKDKYFSLIELAKQQNRSKEEIDVLEAQRLDELNKIKDKFRLEDDAKKATELEKTINDNQVSFENRLAAVDAEQALFQKQFDDKLISEKDFNDKTKTLSDSRIKINELEAAAKEALLNKTSSTASKAAELLGKNTLAGKALSIAAATINTYQGITAELATKTVTPFEIGLKIANVAIIAATGFKAVKDIVSVKVPGAGGGGGSAPSLSAGISGGGGASSAPKFNVVGNSGVNQLAGVIAGKENTPVKAFVVAQDVTTGQGLNRNIIESATLG